MRFRTGIRQLCKPLPSCGKILHNLSFKLNAPLNKPSPRPKIYHSDFTTVTNQASIQRMDITLNFIQKVHIKL